MTTYNTGNAIGSADPRDLYDNAENLDEAVNTRTAESWDDRFGVARKTWYGMEQDFQNFLLNSGYENIGDYAAGLEITARNQIFWRDGELYRAGAALELPYTTTGDWGDEEGMFVAVGDAALRQELSNPDKGALMVRGAVIYVNTIADLQALDTSLLVDGQAVFVRELSSHHVWVAASGWFEPQGSSSLVYRIPTDFSSLNEAFDVLTPTTMSRDKIITLEIEGGYEIGSPISLSNNDYSFFAVTHASGVAGDIVPVSDDFQAGSKLIRLLNARGPIIKCRFDARGVADGIEVGGGSTLYFDSFAGVINASDRNLEVWGSMVTAQDGVFDGAPGIGVRVSNASIARLRNVSASNCGIGIAASQSYVFASTARLNDCASAGASANSSAIIDMPYSEVRNSGGTGIQALEAATINCKDTVVENSTGYAINATYGGRVNAQGAIVSSGSKGLYASTGGCIAAPEASVTSVGNCVHSANQGTIYFRNGVTNILTGQNDIRVTGGGVVFAHGSTLSLPSQRRNFIYPDGVIYSHEVTENRGVATIPENSTSVTVNHGLDIAPHPSGISIAPRDSLGGPATKWWITGIGETSFTINIDAPVNAGSSTDIAWAARSF